MLEKDMFDSEAYANLSHAGLRVLLSIMRQRRATDHGLSEDNPLKCPYSDMVGINSSSSISKGIQELEQKGFIRCIHGGLYKQVNCYVLSDAWRRWQRPKQEFIRKRTRPNFKNRDQLQNLK